MEPASSVDGHSIVQSTAMTTLRNDVGTTCYSETRSAGEDFPQLPRPQFVQGASATSSGANGAKAFAIKT